MSALLTFQARTRIESQVLRKKMSEADLFVKLLKSDA